MMSDSVIQRLRDGKEALRRHRREMSLADKLAELMDLQHLHAEIVGSRRALTPLERPWDVDENNPEWQRLLLEPSARTI